MPPPSKAFVKSRTQKTKTKTKTKPKATSPVTTYLRTGRATDSPRDVRQPRSPRPERVTDTPRDVRRPPRPRVTDTPRDTRRPRPQADIRQRLPREQRSAARPSPPRGTKEYYLRLAGGDKQLAFDMEQMAEIGGDPTVLIRRKPGEALLEAIDFATGIPTAIRNPSLETIGLAAASVLPFRFVAAPFTATTRTARAMGRATRAGLPVREIAREGALAVIPAAGSRIGRAIERVADKVMPRGLQLRQIALENARSERIAQKVRTAPASALRKLRLRASEETALRLAAEGGTVRQHIDYYATRAADPARDPSSRLYHRIHADLVRQASKWVEDGPNGSIRLRANAPKRLKEAWRLLNVTNETREGIYKALGRLTDERIRARINAPGRVIQGAEFVPETGRLEGAEGFIGGQAYIAERMGTPGLGSASGRGPLRVRVGSLGPRNLIRQATATVSRGRRRTIAGIHRDPSLTNAYTGALKDSGFFRTDVSNVAADSLATALRLDSIRQYRARLLAAASDTYQPGYIPIKLNPATQLSGDLKRLWAKIDAIEQGGLTPRDMKRLGLTDEGVAEELARTLFSPADEATKGVKWVPPELIDNAAIGNLVGKTFDTGLVMRLVGAALDLYNDLQRAAILYLNPAYGPVNLIGNTVMNLFQQGVFYPANIMRAFRIFRGLSPEGLATVQLLVGTGLTRAIGTAGTPGVKQVIRTVGDLIQIGSDSMPRWTAFVHAAREFKFLKTAEDFDNLFRAARAGDEESMAVIDRITRRANDAIVDFERLTPIEKNVVSRIVFFYPWLRGSTRYTLRFPLEHPVQAGALGYGGYELMQYANEELGDRPYYSQFDIPIPGAEDERGNPYVLNIRQLLTFTTPFELFEAGAAFVTGNRNAPQILENLVPGIQHGITALTGRNKFGQDVGPGITTFLRESVEDLPPSRFWRAFQSLDGDNSNRLYPRTLRDEFVRMGLGGLAPKPFDRRQAQKQARELRSDKSSKKDEPLRWQVLSQFALDDPSVGPNSKTAIRKWARMERIIRQRTKQKAEKMGINFSDLRGSLTEYQIKLQVLRRVRPELKVHADAEKQLRNLWKDKKARDEAKEQINDWVEFADSYGGNRLSRILEDALAPGGEFVAQTLERVNPLD